MPINTVELNEIPAALPGVEADDDQTRETLREKSLEEFAAERTEQTPADESEAAAKESTKASGETDDDGEDEDFAGRAKPSKKKLFFAFVVFVCGFVLLVVLMCWFFGIGFFSAAKTSRIDRTGKPATAAATDEEKLKMALNIVADKNISANSPATPADFDSPVNAENSTANSSVTVPSAEPRASDLAAPIIVPDEAAAQNLKATGAIDSSATSRVEPISNPAKETKNNRFNDENNRARLGEGNDTSAVGRSLFFGTERKAGIAPVFVNADDRQTISNENRDAAQVSTAALPFGTLLPVRLLGAIYTLRASGGLIRMELTRRVSGKNFAYSAGTVLVGSLRGSEYKRAFVSVVGLIDPASGRLVKFTGEAMGGDGASGFVGRRRKVKGAWSRVLAGLRESAAVAASAIGSRRSAGGTIVISDSTAKASGALSDEFSALVGGGGNRKSDEFVEVPAGTNAYVLVTDLPDEISGVDALSSNSNNLAVNFSVRPNLETGLTDEETADLFASGSPEKLRAALPRMTPRFRQLAEQALAAMEN